MITSFSSVSWLLCVFW